MAHNKGSKGKGKGKKGKGKYPVRPSNLSIEDRRKKLAELKARTPCRACGRNGHWQGDKECTMSRLTAGHLAVRSAYLSTQGEETPSAAVCQAGRHRSVASTCFDFGEGSGDDEVAFIAAEL